MFVPLPLGPSAVTTRDLMWILTMVDLAIGATGRACEAMMMILQGLTIVWNGQRFLGMDVLHLRIGFEECEVFEFNGLLT